MTIHAYAESPPPLEDRNAKVCIWGKVPDIITPIKFNVNWFRNFRFFPFFKSGCFIDKGVAPLALTTVLHYRADCDNMTTTCDVAKYDAETCVFSVI